MKLTFLTMIGIVFVLILLTTVGTLSGKKVKSSDDFLTGGGKAGRWLVCGGIMGALVSSQATIGTAQLAFHFGLSAWWFTLGSGIGCLVLALLYSDRLRANKSVTEIEVISNEYGQSTGGLASILCSLGIFISVLAQVIACSGLLTTLFPQISLPIAAFISIAFMLVFVIFGGTLGMGMGGVLKLILLYLSSLVCFALVVIYSKGFTGVFRSVENTLVGTPLGQVQTAAAKVSNIVSDTDFRSRFLNLIARGGVKDIGSGISLLLGVLSTQTYAQAILSARNDREAKLGALLSAFLIPPVGIAGIFVGLYMRGHYITQAEVDALCAMHQSIPDLPVLANTIQAFPSFAIHHTSPFIGGLILGTLLLSVVGGGAGLSLGMATILDNDIAKKKMKSLNTSEKELRFTRLIIGAILLAVAMITIFAPNTMINDLGFLSMGLRGSVVFLPLTFALWLPGKINERWAFISVILAPISVLMAKILSLSIDPVFIGLLVSMFCFLMGYFSHKKTNDNSILKNRNV